MPASKSDIADWFRAGVDQGASHMLVVVDTFDFEDYPVYVISGVDPAQACEIYNAKDMERVLEVYDLSMDMHVQLGQDCCYNAAMREI